MSEHTPGPWRVPKHAWFRIAPADGLPGYAAIATVYECVHSGRDKNEATANAHLMAAAPELLAACEVALEFIGHQPESDEGKELCAMLARVLTRVEEQ